jgi:cytochrome c oxidase assembly factor CtaG
LYLFFATLPCDILSGFLVFCDRVVYPAYLSSPRRFGLTALADQQCAGALMWTCVTVVYLVAGTIVATRLLSPRWPREYLTLQSGSKAIAVTHTQEQRMEVV